MKTKYIFVDSNSRSNSIVIGKRGENNVTTIIFDIAKLIEKYGAGEASLIVKRPIDGIPYPAVIEQNENLISWIITEIETSFTGSGECELFWYVDDKLVKSEIYKITIEKDIGNVSNEPPKEQKSWIDYAGALVTSKASEVIAIASDAQSSALQAEAWAKGTKDGVAVSPSEIQYNNNSKFWADKAQQVAVNNGYVDLWIDENGALYMARTSNLVDKLSFELTENGELEAVISG